MQAVSDYEEAIKRGEEINSVRKIFSLSPDMAKTLEHNARVWKKTESQYIREAIVFRSAFLYWLLEMFAEEGII